MNENIPNPNRPAPRAAPGSPSLRVIGVRLRFVAILAATFALIAYWDTIHNYWDKWTRPQTVASGQLPAEKEFFCPMHPKVVRTSLEADGSVPKCPLCGMPLSLRTKGEIGAAARRRDRPGATLAGADRTGGRRDGRDRLSPHVQGHQHGGRGGLRREPAVADCRADERLRGKIVRGQDVRPGRPGRSLGRDLQSRSLQHVAGIAAGDQGRRQRNWPSSAGGG